MGTLKLLDPKPLTIYSWGDGVSDVRYFTTQILMPSELAKMKDATGYMPQAYDLKGAIEAINLTMKGAQPGIYFAGNPLEGTYGKWNIALKMAGWTQVPGCALNRVWGNWQAYKPGGKNPNVSLDSAMYKEPWYSPDGFHKWIHAFYYIVPGRKDSIKFDFTEKTRNLKAANGDADLTFGAKGSLWHINYMGGGSGKHLSKLPNYGTGNLWCHNFARLSKSCGVALGYGLPDCGPALDKEFLTIAAQEQDKAWPEGWAPFLEYGGMRWATNVPKLPSTAHVSCPHPMVV